MTATVDEATLRLYQVSRSNGNPLTLAAHRVLTGWSDAEANKIQHHSGQNWSSVGMAPGADYASTADSTVDLVNNAGAWIDLDVKAMVQAWAANPADNRGLVLLQQSAGGPVYYNFCSEVGSVCAAGQAPQLTVWYH